MLCCGRARKSCCAALKRWSACESRVVLNHKLKTETMTNKEKTFTASTEEIRSHFPALERKHNGFPVAYFDGPGGTQVPRAVVEAMNDYLFHHNANTHWAYPTSEETDELIAD